MTKEKLDDLVERAQKFIGQSIPVKHGNDTTENHNQFINHKFLGIGNTVSTNVKGEKPSFEINGKLEAPNGKIVTDIPLYSIVNYFESQE